MIRVQGGEYAYHLRKRVVLRIWAEVILPCYASNTCIMGEEGSHTGMVYGRTRMGSRMLFFCCVLVQFFLVWATV